MCYVFIFSFSKSTKFNFKHVLVNIMLFIKTILIILCHHLVITDIVFAQNNFNSGKLKLKVSDAIFLALRENRSIKSAYIDRIAQKYTLSVAEDQFNPDLFITPSMNQTSNKSSGDRATTNQAGIKLNIPLCPFFSKTSLHNF